MIPKKQVPLTATFLRNFVFSLLLRSSQTNEYARTPNSCMSNMADQKSHKNAQLLLSLFTCQVVFKQR